MASPADGAKTPKPNPFAMKTHLPLFLSALASALLLPLSILAGTEMVDGITSSQTAKHPSESILGIIITTAP